MQIGVLCSILLAMAQTSWKSHAQPLLLTKITPMNLEPKFYVYEHIRPDTGAVFYVGKGHGSRAINFNARSKRWKHVKNESGSVQVRYPVTGVDEELSLLAEMEYIDVLRRRGVDLINESNGGSGTTGRIMSEETRRKIGESNRGKPHLKGEQHGMYGKKHSLESLAKMSEARKGLLAGENHPFYGKHHSDETRRKISDNRKGKMVGADNPFYGKKHTLEVAEKIRTSRIGKKATEETKQKMKQAHLKRALDSKLSKPVFCITNGVTYYGLNEAARELGLHRQSIRMVCNGVLKKTGGFKFEWSKK